MKKKNCKAAGFREKTAKPEFVDIYEEGTVGI